MVEIAVENLTKIFPPNVVALNNIDLEIRDGEFLVVLGPSGSGKTTFLRILAGLEKPTKGRVVIGGKVVADAEKKIFIPPQKRNVGMVFQNWALYPNMTVYDNIAFPLKIKKLPREEIRRRVIEVAEVLGIRDLLNRYPRQLSGGQQQRVALARALVKEPDVLLLDEPFSNLDARIRVTARAFVKKIQRRLRITAILVTHDQADAFAVGDRIVVLRDGRVEQIGTPEELYFRPANTFVADFIGDPPINLIEVSKGDELYSYVLRVVGKPYPRLVIGVRPDEAYIGSGEGVVKVKGVVDTVLYVGSRRYAVVRVGGKPLRVLSSVRVSEGSEVTVTITRLHVFDAETGSRIQTIELPSPTNT